MALTLALDLSTITGFALGDLTGVKVSGTRRLPSTGDDLGYYAHAFRDWLTRGLERHKPLVVVYEQPIIHGKFNNIHTLRKLYGLAWQCELTCRDLKVPTVCEANIGDWRKHFLGAGNVPRKSDACKAAVMQMCLVRGWQPGDHNEADALGILDYALACSSEDHAMMASPLFNHVGRPPLADVVATTTAKDRKAAALKKAAGLK